MTSKNSNSTLLGSVQHEAVAQLLELNLSLAVEFKLLSSECLKNLDTWLLDVLQMDANVYQAIDPVGLLSDSGRAAALLGRACALSRLLLELGRIPIFDQPRFETPFEVDGRASVFKGRVRFVVVAQVPEMCFRMMLQMSMDLCLWAGKHSPEKALVSKFFDTIQDKAIKPLQGLVPFGKSTIPVLRTAHKRGIPFQHLGLGVFQLGWGSNAQHLDRSATASDSSMGAKLSHSKVATSSLLRSAGIPSPVHKIAGTVAQAIEAAASLGFPLVVKPSDRDRGEGVRVDVNDEAALTEAFEVALKLSHNKRVIVERQVPGVCHRLFMVDGKLLYAVKRMPMSVQGNGEFSVSALVDAEVTLQNSKPPWVRSEIQPIDEPAIAAMSQAGFTPDSVPKTGEWVPLRRIESTEFGGVDEEVSNRIHPENLSIAVGAASIIGLGIAGIDIITEDISVPWHENGAIINEVNFAPLLGGAEISRRHIPQFLNSLLGGDGKIPVAVFSAGQEVAAFERRTELLRAGLRCYLTQAERTIGPDGAEVKMALNGLNHRLRALLLRKDVDAVVVWSGQ